MKTHLALAAAAVLLPGAALAEGFNLSARASTLGVGVEAGYAFNDFVNLRVAVNNYSDEYDTTEDGIDYRFDLDLDSTALLLDFHPFAGVFRITAGVLDNGNELNGAAQPAGTYDIGGTTYTGAEVGTLQSRFALGESNPLYLGLGWSKPLGDSGWGMGFDVGVVMMGESDVSLSATGPISSDPTFQSDLAAEEQELEGDINDSFENYPVIALGFTYQF